MANTFTGFTTFAAFAFFSIFLKTFEMGGSPGERVNVSANEQSSQRTWGVCGESLANVENVSGERADLAKVSTVKHSANTEVYCNQVIIIVTPRNPLLPSGSVTRDI